MRRKINYECNRYKFQGLIFVKQPYFNEPGYEKFQGTWNGKELSESYNLQIENATLIYAIMEQLNNSPAYFCEVIRRHFWLKRNAILRQAERWLQDITQKIRDNSTGIKITNAFVEDNGAYTIHVDLIFNIKFEFSDNPFVNLFKN